MFRQGFLNLTIVLSVLNGSIAFGEEVFWLKVDEVLARDPALKIIEARQEETLGRENLAGSWDDPRLELSQSKRLADEGRSSVTSIQIRQKVDLDRDRKQAVFRSQLETLRFDSAIQSRFRESEIVARFYRIDRLRQEKVHIGERKKRLLRIKNSLEGDQRKSPSVLLERELALSILKEMEESFSAVDLELASLTKDLKLGGWEDDSPVSMKWLFASDFEQISKTTIEPESVDSPSRMKEKEILKAKIFQLESQKSLSELDLVAGYDRQTSGAHEKNIFVGISFPLPLGATKSRERELISKELLVVQTEIQMNEKKREKEKHLLGLSAKSITRSLKIYNATHIHQLEEKADAAHQELTRGWISVSQYLELDRRIHSEIEASFDARERAVDWILASCHLNNSQPRQFLGAQR